ncbi:MAG: transcription termination/antitermination protein NusA [Candidatus Carbobacillus altaicus]|nr:transcription termination/antitermination protein NusA [Candidatus Carbobacillus altaicus]
MRIDFLSALDELERERGIQKNVLLDALKQALIAAYKKNYHTAQNVTVHIDEKTGDIRVLSQKTVVEEVGDPRLEVNLERARGINPRLGVGDILEEEVTPKDFGRVAAQTAKQVVTQRLREAERGLIYETYVDREAELVTGLISRIDGRNAYVELSRTEGILPLTEIVPGEVLTPGMRIKAIITRVEKGTKGPQIILSRTDPGFLRRLFEREVPEIYDGTVEIKAIAREAGDRSKVAVYARDPNVDPVGACVGPKGARVQAIVQELGGEKIDIVRWSKDPESFVASALQPAKVLRVEVFDEEKATRVIVPDHQLSLAIGKKGQNARLAAKLTGWKIDIKNESHVSGSEGRAYATHKTMSSAPETVEQETVESEEDATMMFDHEPSPVPEVTSAVPALDETAGKTRP